MSERLRQHSSRAQTSLVKGKTRWLAILFLLILATCLAEFLTGSTPVLRMFTQPIVFLENLGLYGAGSLLIREVAIIWRKRWGAILLLGGAYAVGEEGFAAKTMTDPLGSPVGNQIYNHFAGINWVPLSELTLFHAAFSIMVPLLLTELLFPQTKSKRLVGKIGFTIGALAYAFTVIILSLWLGNPYVPSTFSTIFLTAYASCFIVSAYLAPNSFLQAKSASTDRSEPKFVLLGVSFMGGFFLISLAGRLLPWPLQALLFLPLALLVANYLVRHSGQTKNEIVKVDFILGTIIVFIPIDIVTELGGDVGVLAFTALILGFVLLLRRQILIRNRGLPSSQTISGHT